MTRNRPRRNRPARPYHPASLRRVIVESNRRLFKLGVRGPRAYEAIGVLVERLPQVQSGVVYLGDEKMAERMHRCSKTAHRAKYDLLRAGLVRLHCAGPKMCPCSGCGGEAAGGRILNSHGQPVSAATGYELDPALLTQPAGRAQRTSASAPMQSPAEQSQAQRNAARLRGLKDQLAARAGP